MAGLTVTTQSVKPEDIKRNWYIIDATDMVLGRLSVEISRILRGKQKTYYTPHIDCGDYVIVINAQKVHLTGNKRNDKTFYWHTGHPGGIKERTAAFTLDGRFPERLIEKAVERMVTRNALGNIQMRKLFVYGGSEHPHSAQQPVALDIAKQNPKNKKRN